MNYSIAIIGLGLMGGSLALDLSVWRKKSDITGYDIDRETREWCLRNGIIDRIAESPQDAVKGADLIFVATPVRDIPRVYSIISPHLTTNAVLFDLGSTRQWIFDHLSPRPENHLYCGFHPMGGGVNFGAQYARRQLFNGHPVLVTPYRPLKNGEMNLIEEIAGCMESRVFF